MFWDPESRPGAQTNGTQFPSLRGHLCYISALTFGTLNAQNMQFELQHSRLFGHLGVSVGNPGFGTF